MVCPKFPTYDSRDGLGTLAVTAAERQTSEGDPEKRKPLLWAIERKLAEDDAGPIIFYAPTGACWQPYVASLPARRRGRHIWADRFDKGLVSQALVGGAKETAQTPHTPG